MAQKHVYNTFIQKYFISLKIIPHNQAQPHFQLMFQINTLFVMATQKISPISAPMKKCPSHHGLSSSSFHIQLGHNNLHPFIIWIDTECFLCHGCKSAERKQAKATVVEIDTKKRGVLKHNQQMHAILPNTTVSSLIQNG